VTFPQGINFRASPSATTDGANEDYEVYDPNASGTPQYPRTTPQNNTVGYTTGSWGSNARDRNPANDRRLVGAHAVASGDAPRDYRIDLPTAGTYNIRLAAGDGAYVINTKVELFDNSSSLGVLCSGSTGAGNAFKDATDTIYTAANWPGSNTAVSKTFTSTICLFRIGDGVNTCGYAHFYVESAGGGGPVVQLDAPKQSPLLISLGQHGKMARPWARPSFAPAFVPPPPPPPPLLSPLLKFERPFGRQQIGRLKPQDSAAVPVTIAAPLTTHSYAALAPQVRASVAPAAVVHTYTAQAAKFVGTLKPAQAAHLYTAQTPQVRASVKPAQATHTYTGKVPTLVVGSGVQPPAASHTYTGRAPQVKASVKPAQATHSYTGRAPVVTVGVAVAAPVVAHTYTARAPQARARVTAPVVTHTYAGRSPTISGGGVIPVYGWGARGRVGTVTGRDPWSRIGSQSALDPNKGIGTTKG
jgi:hypothetical protein